MRIEREVDRLLIALAEGGAPQPRPGAGEEVAELEGLVAPLRLPAELAWFWRRVDPRSLAVAPFPDSSEGMGNTEFARVAFAREAFRRQLDDPGIAPPALLCVSVVRPRMRFAELAGPNGDGGRMYEWVQGRDELVPCFESIADWVAAVADGLEAGPWRTIGDPGAALLYIEPEEYARRARVEGATPVAASPEDWPQEWRHAAELLDAKRRPSGPTISISELLSAAREGDVEATVSGAVTTGVVTPAGGRMLVCDGTGILDAFYERTVVTEREIFDQHTFELDVVAGPAVGHPRAEATRTRELPWDETPPQARVKAARPVLFK